MSSMNQLHDQAMELADQSFIAKKRGQYTIAQELINQAFVLEQQAAEMLYDDIAAEPSRSVLYRSAASLAIECKEYRTAEKLIATALAGNPPLEIASELREMLQSLLSGKLVPTQKRDYKIPLIGTIAAGEPFPNVNELDVSLSSHMIEVGYEMVSLPHATKLFAFQVEGKVMVDALINHGDIILFTPQETATNGQLVAAWLISENIITIKEFFLDNQHIRLQPVNPTMAPMYTSSDNVRIHGWIVGVLRSLAGRYIQADGSLPQKHHRWHGPNLAA